MHSNPISITFQVNNGHSLTMMINGFYNSEGIIDIGDDFFTRLCNFMFLSTNPFLAIIAPILWLSVASEGVQAYCKKAFQCDDSEKEMLWDNTDYSGYEAI